MKINFSAFFEQFGNLDNDVGNWPPLPRVLALLIILISAVFLGWFLYCKDLLSYLDKEVEMTSVLMDQFKIKAQKAKDLEELKRQRESVHQLVSVLEKQLPGRSDMDSLLSEINQAGLARGLQFDLFKPTRETPNVYYTEIQIDIKLRGSYHDFAAFAADIAALPRIVTLNDLKIKEEKDGLSLSTTAKTFRYETLPDEAKDGSGGVK